MTTSTNGTFDRKPFIAGNWKMNMDHVQGITLLQKLAWTLSDAKHDYSRVEVAVFPPFTDLRGVQTLVQGDELDVVYGGQDLSQFDSGAYTGDISGQFLAKLGCSYVLVGHSERRTIHNESDDVLNAKTKAAFRHGITPVLCVGEGLEIRQAGTHVDHTLAQLRAGVEGLTPEQAAELVVAYEPVWAIGTGEVAGPGGRPGDVRRHPCGAGHPLRRGRRRQDPAALRRFGQGQQRRLDPQGTRRGRLAGRRCQPGRRRVC